MSLKYLSYYFVIFNQYSKLVIVISAQKTPSQSRASKTIWTNVERNLFFEALNEYGKDFEAIAQYINVKQKRKNATDPTYKAKENIRQLYYQSYHKVSKYLRFSDGKLYFKKTVNLSFEFIVLILCFSSK